LPVHQTRRTPIYAIVRAGGKQYRVEADQLLDIDRIQAEVGSTVELKDVLLLGGSGEVRVGTPVVDGATVLAEVLAHGRDKKVRVFKYKNKTRYRRRFGHRQDFTRLAIRQILADGMAAEAEAAEKPKRPARKRAAPKAKAPEAEAVDAAPEAVEEPAIEAAAIDAEAPKPHRARAAKAKVEAETKAAPTAEVEAPKPRRARATKPKVEAAPEAAAAAEETPEGE
jgi:large subunit ribosomal protein L21